VRDPESDELLWELPRAETADDRPAPDDSMLHAYRQGGLPPIEAGQLEWRLAGSRRGRARLAELAGVRIDAPARPATTSYRRAAAVLAVAATIGIAVLLVVGRGTPWTQAPRPLPDFAIRAEGLATTRGRPGDARALPDGRVRVVVEPRGDAIPGLHFAAYRLDESGLTRLIEPAELAIEADRGSAVLTARADRLIGPAPGTRPFFVVVGDRDPLPDRVAVPAAGAVAELGRISGGRVYQVPLTIVDATDGAP
jgi:hypothetical protein